jgi:DNA modification methylase
MLAFALRADGWWLRSEIIWHKPNPMPESVTDRPTKSHEQIFLLAKSERYYYDAEAIKEPASPDTNARYARGRTGRP